MICSVFGCKALQENVEVTTILAGALSREVGCQVAKTGEPKIDRTIRNVYMTVKSDGKMPDDAYSQLQELTAKRPTLAASIKDLIELFGVSFDADDEILKKIPEPVILRVEREYVAGVELCQIE